MRFIRRFIYIIYLIGFLLVSGPGYAQGRWNIKTEKMVFSDAPFKQCHATTILEINPRYFLVACFGGQHEGNNDVSIWLTSVGAEASGKVVKVADGRMDDGKQYPAWNPVLFRNAKGLIFLFYKVGPNPREWWGMYKTSRDNGQTWSLATRLPQGILGPIKNKPVLLNDGTILSPSSVEENTERWKVHLERSVDDGVTWSRVFVDTARQFNVIQPSILNYTDSRLQLLCRSKEGRVVQSWSFDRGLTWSKLTATALLNPNSGTDAVSLKDGRQLIVYNPDTPGKDWFNGRAKLRVAESTDGLLWKDVLSLENGTTQEFSYPSIIQASDGTVHICYTYDRKNVKYVVLGPLN